MNSLVKPIAVYIAPESFQYDPNVAQIQEEIRKTYHLVTASLDQRGLGSCLKDCLCLAGGNSISLLILDGPSHMGRIVLGKKQTYLCKNVHSSDFTPYLNPSASLMVIGSHSALLAAKISQITHFEVFGFKKRVVKGATFAFIERAYKVGIFSVDEKGEDSMGCYFRKGVQCVIQKIYSDALLALPKDYSKLRQKMDGVFSALWGLENQSHKEMDLAAANLKEFALQGDPVSRKYLMILAKRGHIEASCALFTVFINSNNRNDKQKAASLLKQRQELLEFPLEKLRRKSVI